MASNPYVSNPYVTAKPEEPESSTVAEREPDLEADVEVWEGPSEPPPGVPVPDRADQLPTVRVSDADHVYVVGAHGGAGESTLSAWLEGRATGHAWPVLDSGRPASVVLVARTSAAGMAAARAAVREWASGHAPVQVLALALVADAPGSLPKPLKEEAAHLAGGVPTTVLIPFMNTLRTEPDPFETKPSGATARAVRRLARHLTITTKETL